MKHKMMTDSRERSIKKRRVHAAIWFLLLAVLCLGGTELAFCRYFSPALYKKITDPVVRPAAAAAAAAKDAMISVKEAMETRVRIWQALHRRDSLTSQILAGSQTYLIPEPVPLPEVPQVAELSEGLTAPDPAGWKVTRFREEDGAAILTGGVPCVYYNQGDEAWRDKPYGSDPIGPYGCGPTAMAMVVSTFTGQTVDPAQMAAWAAGEGYWCPGSGSYPELIEDAAKAYGLECDVASDCDARGLFRHLSGGGMAVALVGPGHFTSSGHFIVLHGVTLGGEVLVADPNSRENSLATWDPQLILDEAAASDGNGVRLWLISVKRHL